jgi:hypothetical protein
MDNFQSFKDLMLSGMATIVLSYLAYQVKQLVDSVNALNTRMAEVITHLENHKEKLDLHNRRLERLEDRLDNA